MEQLLTKLTNTGLLVNNNIILAENMSVDKETFLVFFGTTNGTYTTLITADDGKGYTQFFDEWKAKGIL